MPDAYFEQEDFALNILRDAKANSQIALLNSFIANDTIYCEAIERALSRGANVRILLMSPKADSPVANARWEDCYRHYEEYAGSYDDFIREIESKFRKFERLGKTASALKRKSFETGTYEMRSYSSSLNLPMVLVWDRLTQQIPERGYTGFYTTVDANRMPFIEWRGGDFRILEKFGVLFDQKWESASII